MPSTDLQQGRIHYEEAGPSGGRPVVLVHGFMMGASLWSPVMPMLAERGLRVIAPAWPLGSHREPMTPGTDLAPRGIAALVAAFLDALDLHDVVLVGSDSGGAISQVVAAHHPDRLGALVLANCDTLEHFPPSAFKPLAVAAKMPAAFKAALAPMGTAAARRSPLGYGMLTHGDIDDLAREWVRPALTDDRVREDVRTFTAGMDKSVTLEAAARLKASDLPILLAWGDDDRLFPVKHAERFVAEVPRARLEIIEGARTLPMLDRPERFAALVGEAAPASAAAVPGT